MSNCCICQFTVRNPRNIHAETIGQPPILISELLLQCTRGTNYALEEEATICKKCNEKLSRYHRNMQIAKKLRQEILELIRSPYVIKEFKTALSRNKIKIERIEKFDDSIVEAVVSEDDEALTLEEPSIEEIEEEELSSDIKNDNIDEAIPIHGEFQEVELELDIENEIVINKEDEVEVELDEKHLIDEEHQEYQENENNISDFEDHLDETIEYIISDGEYQDNENSVEYSVNIQCPNCPDQFGSRRAYNAHTKREHFPGYVCDQCGKTLQSYSGFLGHLQNHEPVKQFVCPECGERFSRKFRLKHHMAWHTGETPYQCDVCLKRFVHKVALYKHKMIHDNETKRLECNVCGFKTRTKAHLERHMRSHTGAKPFACPVCKKCFSQMYNMKAHLREHENPGCNRQRRFHCTKCTHSFINEQNFVSHCERGDCTPV